VGDLAAPCVLGDDPGVVRGVRRDGDGRDQGVEVGHSAEAAKQSFVGEVGRDGNRVAGLARGVEPIEDAPQLDVCRAVEVLGLHDAGQVGNEVRGEQSRTDDGAFGGLVVGWGAGHDVEVLSSRGPLIGCRRGTSG
jgi:hypothetical protein